jgi:hypothetical protein
MNKGNNIAEMSIRNNSLVDSIYEVYEYLPIVSNLLALHNPTTESELRALKVSTTIDLLWFFVLYRNTKRIKKSKRFYDL